jgi:glycosyltransferase involved in cell wall biosynthesis
VIAGSSAALDLAEPGAPSSPVPASSKLPAHRLSIVVPMYNERANVEPMLDDLHAALEHYPWPWELIAVDDGSSDGTGLALEHRARALGPHVRVLCLRRNFRQTAATQAGIDAARGDVVVMLDGDLQNDPRDIPALVERLLRDDLDLVAGRRHRRQDGFLLRRLPSRLANSLIGRLTKLPFRDFGCSLKAYRASVLREVRLYGEMHRFIPAWLATVTAPERMAEVDVNHRARASGQSKYGLSRTFRVVIDLLAVHFFLHYSSRPGHFFGGIGLAVGALGAAILGWLAFLKLALGEAIGGRPLLALGFFCVLGGLQFLTTGILAELLVRIYHGRDGAHTSYALRKPAAAAADDDAWHVAG